MTATLDTGDKDLGAELPGPARGGVPTIGASTQWQRDTHWQPLRARVAAKSLNRQYNRNDEQHY